MNTENASGRCSRRRFVASLAAVLGGESLALLEAGEAMPTRVAGSAKRIFVAESFHETNTFHPLRTDSYSYSRIDPGFSLPGSRAASVSVARGPILRPNSGGTISESPCRQALDRVLDSLRAAGPVHGVFLRLHGAMFAEGIGPAESILVREIRRILGPEAPIACTFDLHGIFRLGSRTSVTF